MVKTNTVLRSAYQILENRAAIAQAKADQAMRELQVERDAMADIHRTVSALVMVEDIPVGYLFSFEGRQFILSFAGNLMEKGKTKESKYYSNLFDAQMDIFMGRVGNDKVIDND